MTNNPAMRVKIHAKSFNVIPEAHRGFWEDCAAGTWEPDTFEILDRFVGREGSYLDIGSWIGPTLLYAAQSTQTAYGIEPDPLAFRELAANLAANEDVAQKVRLFNGCIADKSGPVSFGSRGDGGDSMSSLLFTEGNTCWTVPALTFDDFLRQNQITDCHFIKMDIEGGEFTVLPTMLNHLKRQKPTLYLSLHPRFLPEIEGYGIIGKSARAVTRVWRTFTLLRLLGFYRRIYSERGASLNLLTAALSGIRGTCSVALTDEIWD